MQKPATVIQKLFGSLFQKYRYYALGTQSIVCVKCVFVIDPYQM